MWCVTEAASAITHVQLSEQRFDCGLVIVGEFVGAVELGRRHLYPVNAVFTGGVVSQIGADGDSAQDTPASIVHCTDVFGVDDVSGCNHGGDLGCERVPM